MGSRAIGERAPPIGAARCAEMKTYCGVVARLFIDSTVVGAALSVAREAAIGPR